MCVNPVVSNSRIPATCRWTSGPQGICVDTSSWRTVLEAASNDAGIGKFGFTLRVPIGVVGAISPFNFPLNLV